MLKTKLCGFAIACMVGFLGISPISVLAAETDIGSITLSNRDKDDENKSASKERWKQAKEKWNSLSDKQKDEVYSLLEKEIKANIKVMEKLSNLGIIQKEDCEAIIAHVEEEFKDAKEDREFPYSRHKSSHKGRGKER